MKKKIFASFLSLALFGILTLLVKKVDVVKIESTGREVGFSKINIPFHELFGENILLYDLTQFFGYIAVGIIILFFLVGCFQLFSRKSFKKVDSEIYALGSLYAVLLSVYAFFEKVIINYRPIIMEGETEAEASFPSSHTMLICVIMLSTVMVLPRYVKNEKFIRIVSLLCRIIAVVTVIFRLVCGVHWLTDVIAGLLLSLTLILQFSAVFEYIEKNKI